MKNRTWNNWPNKVIYVPIIAFKTTQNENFNNLFHYIL